MFRQSFMVLFTISTLLLLSACGPTNAQNSAAPIDPSGPDSETLPSAAISLNDSVDVVTSSDNVQSDVTDVADAMSNVSESDEIAQNEEGVGMGFTEDGHPYIGNLDAPIVIEEFSDFQCPYCVRFFTNTMPQLLDGAIANGDAVLIFYDYPLAFHAQAIDAANAARCAGEQNVAAYWAMHDKLFATVDRWSISDPASVFKELASELPSLNSAAFGECVNLGRYVDAINEDIALGESRGITGTPTFMINGQPFVGAQPITAFEQVIQRVLDGESIIEEPPSVDDVEIPPFAMPEQTVLTDDYAGVLGNPDAPILIVELTDYQCPFCSRHSFETMPQILSQLIETGRVRYALKDFPLDQLHPDARLAATAARCAGEQDAYWEMHDLLFAQQALWGQGNNPDVIGTMQQFAADLELDTPLFDECVGSGRYDDSIQAHVDEGFSAGVSGTPAFFIDGYFLSGAQPYQVFDLIVSNIEDGTIEALFRDAYDQQVQAYKDQLAAEQAAQLPPEPVDVPLGDAYTIGDPDAPIVVVEYTDFQCPYCGRHFSQTFPLIKENYIDTGLVRYVFKDFPLNFHAEAGDAAEAARCAGDQDAFLEMHSKLFASQGEWSGHSDVETLLVKYADDLELDVALFASCLEGGKYTAAVNADLNEGSSFGVTGTPSFFVNGLPLFGALPYDSFAQAIDSMLDEQQ